MHSVVETAVTHSSLVFIFSHLVFPNRKQIRFYLQETLCCQGLEGPAPPRVHGIHSRIFLGPGPLHPPPNASAPACCTCWHWSYRRVASGCMRGIKYNLYHVTSSRSFGCCSDSSWHTRIRKDRLWHVVFRYTLLKSRILFSSVFT